MRLSHRAARLRPPRSSQGDGTARFLVIACALLIGACGGGRDVPAVRLYDLLAELPAAALTAEVLEADFDDPAQLVSGFSEAQKHRQETLVWAVGHRAAVDLTVFLKGRAPRDLELLLEGRAFHFPGAPQQKVAITVNGKPVGALKLEPRDSSYRLPVGAGLLVDGRNRFGLRFARADRPAEVRAGSEDERPLAASFTRIALVPAGSPADTAPTERDAAAGRVRPTDDGLFVPFGSQADYYLQLDPGAELHFERRRVRGRGTLQVFLQTEGGDDVRRGSVGPDDDAVLLLAGGGSAVRQLARLRLRALAAGPEGDGGVLLQRPEIWAPEGAAEPPPARQALLPAAAEPSPRPNVLIYLIDTLRADRLGCYGSEAGLTPAIDAFADDAVLFEHVVAQSSWTKASVASIFTGLWPARHGAMKRPHKLAPEASTLAEHLREAGYRTAAFVANPNVSDRFGFDQGFEDFTYYLRDDMNPSDELTEQGSTWIDGHVGGGEARPFFLYLHNVDPHDPYMPPPEFRERHAPHVPEAFARRVDATFRDMTTGRRRVTPQLLRRMAALYAGDIAYNDSNFGHLIDFLRDAGLYEPTLILFLSDHGEEFYEHKHLRHGRSLHGESLRVPLILKLPGNTAAGQRIAEPVQHVDVLPTLLAYLGVEAPPDLEGRNLLAAAAGPEALFSYLHLDGPPRLGVRVGPWKLLARVEGESFTHVQLYDLRADPGETKNLAGSHPVRAGYLASLARRRLAAGSTFTAGEAVVDEKVRRDLEALGYLQ